MLLLDYLNTHYTSWEELLTSAPYNLKVSKDGNYYLFKYDMINSDMSNPIVREARGCIFYDTGEYFDLVCYPFDKFFNYNEPANDIRPDWSTSKVQEKIDGSLIKLWYHNHKWHISTNGTIDAAKANAYGSKSFLDLVLPLIQPNAFWDMDINYCYMFEYVSPKTQIVIPYKEQALYYLGSRDMRTLEEYVFPAFWAEWYGFYVPKTYSLASLEECEKAAAELGDSGEGFVVCDSNFRRVKIKSPQYVALHHAISNVQPTDKFFLECLRNNNIDDVLSLKPVFKEDYEDFKFRLFSLMEDMKNVKKSIPKNLDKKEYALYIKDNHLNYSGFLFGAYETPYDYLEKLPLSKVCNLLNNFR